VSSVKQLQSRSNGVHHFLKNLLVEVEIDCSLYMLMMADCGNDMVREEA
jgi:hypothetical protein